MQVKDALLTLSPYKPGKPIEEVKRQYGLTDIIKLASNENPFGYAPAVREAIVNELDHLALYPDGYAQTLRTKVATKLNVAEEQLIFGNGSDEIVQIISRALVQPGKNTVMATPTFPQYRHNATIEGGEIRQVTLIDGKHDLDGMLAAIDDNTTVVWLCTPNNPTGVYIEEAELRSFVERVPAHVLIVVDEAYYEFAKHRPNYPNALQYVEQYENVIVLRTFSKAYGLAALRVGYGVARPELLKKIEPAREPFNTSRVAQVAAIAALDDEAFIADVVAKNDAGLQQYYAFCDKHQLSYYRSSGNFILIDFGVQGDEIFQYLLERGVIVRSGNALGFPTSVRISVGTHEQNEKALELLEQFLLVVNK